MNPSTLVDSQTATLVWQALKQTPLESLATVLVQHFQWTPTQAEAAILRYKMFLFLKYLYPHETLAPTAEMDLVWHQHILLDIAQYLRDCQNWFGFFMNHSQLLGACPDPAMDTSALHQTHLLFELHFGADSWKALDSTDEMGAACDAIPMQLESFLLQEVLSIP